MFTEKQNYMVITIINYRQLPELMKVIQKHPNTFVYYSEVDGVRANFRRAKKRIDFIIDFTNKKKGYENFELIALLTASIGSLLLKEHSPSR